jgi:hypothetical protein
MSLASLNSSGQASPSIGFYPPCGLVTVHDWKLDVHHDQVRSLLGYGSYRVHAVVDDKAMRTAVQLENGKRVPKLCV